MAFDNRLIAAKLRRWEGYLASYHLPEWDMIPNFGLYMEQVIGLLEQYLNYLPPELRDEQLVTPAAINNYVRKKIMPKPENKKYYRIHIAYLLILCSLKQSISVTTIHTMLPDNLTEEQVRETYENYRQRQREAARYFIEQVRIIAGPLLDHEGTENLGYKDTIEFITFMATLGGFSRLLTEKLLLLDGKDLSTGGSIEIEHKKDKN